MLTLNDGRSELWQWDTGRKLTVDADCSQVHFSNKVFGRSIDVDVVDGIADIPDTLLQTDKELTAWAFVGTAENGYTKISKVFKVNKRNKPADYVFTEPDQTTLGEILGRIEDLENRPSGDVSKEDIQDAVNEYLDNNPVSVDEKDPTVPDWAKQPQKPTYTAAEVGALPDTTKIPSTAEDVGALPANAFIPKTAADVGAIPVPETATVGQTIVVKEVDESGKPVSWECVDIASGGGGNEWELITEITTTEEVAGGIVITQNDNGISLSELKYTEIWYMAKMEGVSTNTHNWWEVVINTDDTNVKCVSSSSGGTAARRYVHLYAFLRGGKLYFSNTNANPFVISGGSDNWLHNYLDYNIATYITSLTISANSNAVVGVDSEIKILGRRGH